MRADRRIDPALRLLAIEHDAVQRLAHAVQPLELEHLLVVSAISRMAATLWALCVANCG